MHPNSTENETMEEKATIAVEETEEPKETPSWIRFSEDMVVFFFN